MLNLTFVNPNPPSSPTLTEYILGFSRLRTAEIEALYKTLHNRLLTFLQNPISSEHHKNRVSFGLLYCIQRFIFIDYPYHTQFEPTSLQQLPLPKVPTTSSVQVLQDSSTHRQLCVTQWPLICSNFMPHELPSVESYGAAIMITRCLSVPCPVLPGS